MRRAWGGHGVDMGWAWVGHGACMGRAWGVHGAGMGRGMGRASSGHPAAVPAWILWLSTHYSSPQMVATLVELRPCPPVPTAVAVAVEAAGCHRSPTPTPYPGATGSSRLQRRYPRQAFTGTVPDRCTRSRWRPLLWPARTRSPRQPIRRHSSRHPSHRHSSSSHSHRATEPQATATTTATAFAPTLSLTAREPQSLSLCAQEDSFREARRRMVEAATAFRAEWAREMSLLLHGLYAAPLHS